MTQESLFHDGRPIAGRRVEGYVEIDGRFFSVWERDVRIGSTVKLRETGGSGCRLGRLERYLSEHPEALRELIAGEVIVYE